ncbi:heme-binding protein [Rhodococcus opacus]|uniref:heme-binding protein n=1 Tax=Rhodococcus opacus TaxID=37919 RepID=UPI001F54165C|nr:heme-binding protein [Rhodococcus opacus]
MTLTAARAQLAHDLARRHAATLDAAVAVSVADDTGNLMCCSRTDGAAAELLDSATRTALGTARPPSVVPGHASSRPSSTRSTGSTSDTAATFRDRSRQRPLPRWKVVCDYLVARDAT